MTLKWTWYPVARMSPTQRMEVRYQLTGIRSLARKIVDAKLEYGFLSYVLVDLMNSRAKTAVRILQQCDKPKMAMRVLNYIKIEEISRKN